MLFVMPLFTLSIIDYPVKNHVVTSCDAAQWQQKSLNLNHPKAENNDIDGSQATK